MCFFEPLTRMTLDRARLVAGNRVLDLACGTGIVARLATSFVGREGEVVAIDVRPGMIAKARSIPPPSGAPVDFRVGDASGLDLPDGRFDVILCQQGLQFFSDKVGAAREMRRVHVSGGRIVLAIWRGVEHQTLMADLVAAEARHLDKLGVPFEDVAAPFLLDSADEIHSILRLAGFCDIEFSEASMPATFPSALSFVRDVELA